MTTIDQVEGYPALVYEVFKELREKRALVSTTRLARVYVMAQKGKLDGKDAQYIENLLISTAQVDLREDEAHANEIRLRRAQNGLH